MLRHLLSKTPVIIPHLLSAQEFDLFLGNMIHMVPASYQNVSSVCCLRQAIGMFSPLALGGIWHWLLDQIPHLFHTQHRATGTICPLPRLPTKLPHLFGASRTRPVTYGTGSWPKSQLFSGQGSALVPSHIGIFSPSGFLMAPDPHSKTVIISCLALDYPPPLCFGNWYHMRMAPALHQDILSTLCQDGTLTVGTFSRSIIGAKGCLLSLGDWCHLAPATHQTTPPIYLVPRRDQSHLLPIYNWYNKTMSPPWNTSSTWWPGQHLCYFH